MEEKLADSQEVVSQLRTTIKLQLGQLSVCQESIHRLEKQIEVLRSQVRDRDLKLEVLNRDRDNEHDILDEMLRSSQEQLTIIESLEQQNNALAERLEAAEQSCKDLSSGNEWKTSKTTSICGGSKPCIQGAHNSVEATKTSITSRPLPTIRYPESASDTPNRHASSTLNLAQELAEVFDKSGALKTSSPCEDASHVLRISASSTMASPIPKLHVCAATETAPSCPSNKTTVVTIGTQTSDFNTPEKAIEGHVSQFRDSNCCCETAERLKLALQEIRAVKRIVYNHELSMSQRMRAMECLYPDVAASSSSESIDDIDIVRESGMFKLNGYQGMTDAHFARVPGSPGALPSVKEALTNAKPTAASSLTLWKVNSPCSETFLKDSPILGHSEGQYTRIYTQLYEDDTSKQAGVPPRRDSLWSVGTSEKAVGKEKTSGESSRQNKTDNLKLDRPEDPDVSFDGAVRPADTIQSIKAPARSFVSPAFSSFHQAHASADQPVLSSGIRECRASSPRHEWKRSEDAIARTNTSLTSDSSSVGVIEHTRPVVDPMIEKLTQCVIGTEMYKYVRTQKKSIFGVNRKTFEDRNYRHKRFVTLKPHDGTICWSSSRQAGLVLGLRRCYIEEIFDVEDNNPRVAGQSVYNRSLLIISRGQSLKFTAQNGRIHALWYEVITYLIRQRKASIQSASVACLTPIAIPKTRTLVSADGGRRSSSLSGRMTARPVPIARNRPSMPSLSDTTVKGSRAHMGAGLKSDVKTSRLGNFRRLETMAVPTPRRSSVKAINNKFRETQMTLRAGMTSPMSTRSAIVAVPRMDELLPGPEPRRAASLNVEVPTGMERTLSAFIT